VYLVDGIMVRIVHRVVGRSLDVSDRCSGPSV